MSAELGRIRWMCRRGMLELDVLLERFLDRKGYAQLSLDEKQVFENLLKSPDPVLYSWFLGYEAPEDEQFQKLIKKIMLLV